MTSMQKLIGATLGQYKIIKLAGQGGMATVFQAHQPGLNRDVALKVLPPYVAERPGFSERFSREAQAIGNLHHPNILPVYDFGQDKGYGYIAMRYIADAKTLAHLMKNPLSTEQVIRLAEQIAGALDHAHQAGIIHRDIKPSNILMDGDWVMLSDFGLAKMVEDPSELTGTGIGIGTPAYMSPEQAKGEKIDHRTDVFALGIILYEMLTGQVPHKGETPMGTVIKRINEPLPMPRSLNPDIPQAVEAVLLKALSIEPAKRYNSAGALTGALKNAFEEQYSPAAALSAGAAATPARVAPAAEPIAAARPKTGISPVEIPLMVILGIIGMCGISGFFLSFGTNADTGQSNFALAPACLGMSFAGFTTILMIWLRPRIKAASALLAAGMAMWFVGINILGWGGFAVLSPGDNTFLENLGFSLALCFAPGGFLAVLGLLAYGIDFRRARSGMARQVAAKAGKERAAMSAKADVLDEKLKRAAEYRKHIDKLIKQKKGGPYADQLAPITNNLTQWENRLRQLVARIRNFDGNEIIQRDLAEVPANISRLEAQLKSETNPHVRKEIGEALDSYRVHQSQLDSLVTLKRRTELDIDETLAAIGAIYSQLQLIGAKEIDSRRAKRLSSDISEQALRLDDLLSAMDDVYESSVNVARFETTSGNQGK